MDVPTTAEGGFCEPDCVPSHRDDAMGGLDDPMTVKRVQPALSHQARIATKLARVNNANPAKMRGKEIVVIPLDIGLQGWKC